MRIIIIYNLPLVNPLAGSIAEVRFLFHRAYACAHGNQDSSTPARLEDPFIALAPPTAIILPPWPKPYEQNLRRENGQRMADNVLEE